MEVTVFGLWVYKLKTKDSEKWEYSFCLGNI